MVAGGLTICLSNLEMFVVVKTFPTLEALVGDHGIFWIYAGNTRVTATGTRMS